MNTKQVLYNALTTQLEAKKIEAEKYTNEVYNPASDNLKTTILEYFEHNIGIFKMFDFTGSNIRLEISSNWSDRIDIMIPNTWRDESKHVQIEWNGGSYNINDNDKKNYLELLNKVYANFDKISNKYLTEWYPTYLDIENKNTQAWKEHKDLKEALDNLQNEIKQDTASSMKQIGFEIKSFKPKYKLDWKYIYNSGERTYSIETDKRSIKLQTGRSQYDNVWVQGFKVLGKKGNKYKVEIYSEHWNNGRVFDVLEKKFESFIEDVCEWETQRAEQEKQRVDERYNSYVG